MKYGKNTTLAIKTLWKEKSYNFGNYKFYITLYMYVFNVPIDYEHQFFEWILIEKETFFDISEKVENTILGYKKRCKLKKHAIFVKLWRYLIYVLPPAIAFKHPVNIYIEKYIFFNTWRKKWENAKSTGFGYTMWSKLKINRLFVKLRRSLIWVLPSIIVSNIS